MDEVCFRKIAIANEKNSLVNYSFDYEILDNQNSTYTVVVYDTFANAYKLGDSHSSYEEAYEAIKGFNRKLDELYDHSEEILTSLQDIPQ